MTDNLGEYLLFGLVFVVILLLSLFAALTATTNQRCLAVGWPSGKITWNLERYCTKRIDQTDHVKLLSELEADR